MKSLAFLLAILLLAGCDAKPAQPDQGGILRPVEGSKPVHAQKSAITQTGLAQSIHVLADVPACGFPENWPGEGLPAWAPDGRSLLYTGPGQNLKQYGPAMLLDLNTPEQPRPVSDRIARDPAWRPDGQSIAFVSPREDPGQSFEPFTIYLQRLGGGKAIDLLSGDLAIQSVSTSKYIHRWVDETLLYEEHMGTGIQQLFLLNTVTKEPVTSLDLHATFFIWSADGNRVAGQIDGAIPRHFWLWDRRFSKSLQPAEPLPGEEQYFDAWLDDGSSALFTAWEGGFTYEEKVGTPALYRLDVEQGRFRKMADNATLAAWSGDMIAYVKWESELNLVIARAGDGKVLWEENLGVLPDEAVRNLREYRPTFAGPYLCYRTTGDEWRVSTKERKDSRTIYVGKEVGLSWSPDGRYVALQENGTPARLRVVENPLVAK